jgi:hypothetical protein
MRSSEFMARYAVGQVWKYKTRSDEESSLLHIAKIDVISDEEIFHIYIEGLQLANPRVAGGIQSSLPHAPVSRVTLDASVTELVRENAQMSDISEPYQLWREPFDKGDAGVWAIPLSELIQLIESVGSAKSDA